MPLLHPASVERKLAALHEALGPIIAGALRDARTVEVMVNPDGKIWIDRIGEGRRYSGFALCREDADRIMRLLADQVGEVVTREHPRVSATLPVTGERFQGQSAPLVSAPAFTIRKRPELIYRLDDYVADGSLTTAQADSLKAAVDARENLLIVGGAGSGKTTFANAVLAEPGFAEDRVVIIEDTAELQCSALDQVSMLTRRSTPAVTLADLVRDTLRLRPDRIIVGEVRDGCALDLLKAWNTGHPGGLTTLHANSAPEALSRLEELIGEVTPQIPYAAIARAINVIVFIRRTAWGRKVDAIYRVAEWRDGAYLLRDR